MPPLPPLHPACEAWDDMSQEALTELADDIKKNGQIEPITMLGKQLLDGRCRWTACNMIDVEPIIEQYDGDSPVLFVISKNLRRRHLNSTELAVMGDKMSNLAHGTNRHKTKHKVDRTQVRSTISSEDQSLSQSQEAVGKALGVSGRSIRRVGIAI